MLAPVLAILPSLGFQEMFVLLVIGLLLYGRNLPEAGRTLGRVAAQLRRGFHEFKDQMDRDASVDEMKRTLKSTKEEITRTAKIKRAVIDPKAALRDLTNAALSSPLPESESESEAESGAPNGSSTPAESSGSQGSET